MAAHAPQQPSAQRQPPPSLFLGPPSYNSSRTSLPSILVPGAHASAPAAPALSRDPLLRNRSARNAPTISTAAAAAAASIAATIPSLQQSEAQRSQQPPTTSPLPQPPDRTSLLWAEMQETLKEVELSASSTTHLFGPTHSSALSRLRASQIALAQAWARSEATEDTAVDNPLTPSTSAPDPTTPHNNSTANPDSNPLPPEPPTASSTSSALSSQPNHSKPEAETENDALLARRRREANDQYFERVNGGVLDVVAKLEEVAIAMREVERESRDIWSDSEEEGGGSVNEGGVGGSDATTA